MSDGAATLTVLVLWFAIAVTAIVAVRKARARARYRMPIGDHDAAAIYLAGAAGDSSMPVDAGHHGGACDSAGHISGGDAGSCDGGGGGGHG